MSALFAMLPESLISVCLPCAVFFPLLAAPFLFLFRGKKEDSPSPLFSYLITVSVLTLLLSLLPLGKLLAGGGAQGTDFAFGPGGLHFTADFYRVLYGSVCAFLFAMTAIFSPRYFGKGEHLPRYGFFLLLTFGATMGVFYSADLLTCFCFFEILSLASVFLVVHEQTEKAISAATTYLAVSVFGGLLLFLGIAYLYSITETLFFAELASAMQGKLHSVKLWIAGICILLGFGAKAGMFPLHIWLPKAHPAAPAPASALLSGILTKVGVYGILLTVPSVFGNHRAMVWVLLTLAAVTMLLGALLGVFSTDLKRTLACSSMSQIGFILTGIACAVLEPSAFSAGGTVLHMMNHSFIKLTLFMAAGAIYENAHTLDLSKLRGVCSLRKKEGRAAKSFLALCFLLGSLDIAGVPLFGGYISKTLLHEAVAEAGKNLGGIAPVFEWIFLFSGGLTLAYMLKLFVCLFLEKPLSDRTAEKHPAGFTLGKGQLFALTAATAALLPLGMPSLALRLGGRAGTVLSGKPLYYEENIFSGACLKGIVISVLIGLLVYFLFVRIFLIKKGEYRDLLPKKLDLEFLIYRPFISLAASAGSLLAKLPDSIGEGMDAITARLCAAGSFLARIPDTLSDAAVYLLQRTVLRPFGVRGIPHTGSAVSDALGKTADRVTGKPGHVEKYAAGRKRRKENRRRLTGSFYFTMAAACLGIVVIIVYVLAERYLGA